MGTTTMTTYVGVDVVSKDFNTAPEDARYDLIEPSIVAAEELINEYCARNFGQKGTADVPDVREFNVQDCVSELYIGDYVSLSSVETREDVDDDWEEVDFSTRPQKTTVNDITPFYRIVVDEPFPTHSRIDTVRVSGIFGWPMVPKAIEQATRLQAGVIFSLMSQGKGMGGLHPSVKELIDIFRMIRL